MIFGFNGVYQLDEELKTATTLINWEDYNIDGSQVDSVLSLGEGRFLVYVQPIRSMSILASSIEDKSESLYIRNFMVVYAKYRRLYVDFYT